MTDKAARILRAAGNRQGRGRLTKTSGTARTYAPRGVVIATAELGAMGKSAVARQLTVDVREPDLDLALLTDAQRDRTKYSYGMRGFIEWVAESYDTLKADCIREMDERRRNADRGQHGRLADAANALYVAFDVALTYATAIGAISEARANDLCAEFATILPDMTRRQQEKITSEDPATKFISSLVSLMMGRKVLIEGRKRPDLGGETRIGWWNGTEINLIPESAYNAVMQFLGRSGEHFAASISDLGRDLVIAGWAKVVEEDRNTIDRVDPAIGKRSPVYCLVAAKFVEHLSLIHI